MFKLISGLMIILFILAASVQLNDPDPLVWIVVYLSALMLTILHTMKLAPLPVMLLFTLCYSAGAIYLSHRFPDTSLEAFMNVGMNSVIEEEVRELWGLVICAVWSLIMLARQLFSGSTED